MAVGWYIVPYKRRPIVPSLFHVIRYCEMDDFTPQIEAMGGRWDEVEILGNRAVVRVVAPPSQLALIDLQPGFRRLPKDKLTDPLSDLSPQAKQRLKDEILNQGYSLAEVRAALGDDLGQKTLLDVLRFMATRRVKPRYDEAADEVVFDGEVQDCESIDGLDKRG